MRKVTVCQMYRVIDGIEGFMAGTQELYFYISKQNLKFETGHFEIHDIFGHPLLL